jgi:hypothetical protein
MKRKHIILGAGLLLVLLSSCVDAWENSSINEDFRRFREGDVFKAVAWTYTNAFGGGTKGQIFYVLVMAIPYTMLLLAQKNIFTPNALMVLFLWLYRTYVPAVAWQTIVIMLAFAAMATIWKAFTVYYSD